LVGFKFEIRPTRVYFQFSNRVVGKSQLLSVSSAIFMIDDGSGKVEGTSPSIKAASLFT
jgi:hypothetical protein